MNVKESLLGKAKIYQFAQSLFGSSRSQPLFINEYLRPKKTDRVLDIGCGTANILRYLDPDINYCGVDFSSKYIESAKKKFGSRGRFHLLDVDQDLGEWGEKDFDIAMGLGVLHHLDDQGVHRFFDLAKRSLRGQGRVVTVDGVYFPKQRRLSRFVVSQDRGEYIRWPEQYEALAKKHFQNVRWQIRSDLNLIPYDVLIMECETKI